VVRVLAEVACVQVLDRPYSVLVISMEVGEPVELPASILAVVPALTALVFPLSVRKSSTTASIRTTLRTSVTFGRLIAVLGTSNRGSGS
jgi:hypothetical protein